MSKDLKVHRVGIIMNGVTGRMGTNQHLLRSVSAIMKQGGVRVGPNEVIMPDPLLVGRNPEKLKKLTEISEAKKFTTDLKAALKDPAYSVYFDSQGTLQRTAAVKAAAAAGKHIYCEKPTAITTAKALELYHFCKKAGVKSGVVQDKLWLPGLLKLRKLIDSGFFGQILSVRGEFGYWVFEGHTVAAQRPSWNYRKQHGGGIIIDMLCHWRYVLDQLFGEIQSLSCLGATHIRERVDESGKPYRCTADDAAYATFELKGGIIAHVNSSWCVRVRRDDLLVLQVDGTQGSAVAGLRKCWVQNYQNTPRPVWNPDVEQPVNFFEGWSEVPDAEAYENAFKIQWELFLKHVVLGTPFQWTLLEGAKGVQLAELGLKSWKKRAWVDVPKLK
jgi:predicted dehydrogenase